MNEVKEINSDSFQSEVLDSDIPVMVDFSAVWCGPCKMLDPIVEELAADWGDTIKVVKLDIDHNPDIPMQYRVMGVPTLMIFKDGEEQDRIVGYQPKQRIAQRFGVHLQAA